MANKMIDESPAPSHAAVNAGVAGGEKKRRGRPRKSVAGSAMPISAQPVLMRATASPIVAAHPVMSAAASGNRQPPGSIASPEASDGLWRAHVINVLAGEDVIGKIMFLAQDGPRVVCLLSANGPVSVVVLRQPGPSFGAVSYQGHFEILSLSGSYTVFQDGARSWREGFKISLSGPDGRVFGGEIAGPIIAASPTQVVVGSFWPGAYDIHRREQQERNNAGAGTSNGGGAEKPADQGPRPDINIAAPEE